MPHFEFIVTYYLKGEFNFLLVTRRWNEFKRLRNKSTIMATSLDLLHVMRLEI